MNARIKELEPQCWEHNEFGLNFNYEKFAKLIIKEAGEAFWSEACHVSDLAYEEYSRNSKKIKQHFGVEE